MIFWRIEIFGKEELGWQIMDSNLSNAMIFDSEGNLMEGSYGYKHHSESNTPPDWWADDMMKKENVE